MTNKILIVTICLMFILGVSDAFVSNKTISSILEILGDTAIFVFGYFLCLKHNYESTN